ERVAHQWMVAELRQEFSIGSTDGFAVEIITHLNGLLFRSCSRNVNVADGARSRRCQVVCVMESQIPRPWRPQLTRCESVRLPLRHLSAGARGDPRRCGERVRREAAMNYVPKIDRRSFVVSAAAVGGGLALGLDLPLGGPQVIRAQDGSPEVNAWVVIRPDDTVVIRIARSEMGQGT